MMSFDNVEVGQQADSQASAPIGITSFDEVSEVVEKVEEAAKAEKTEANKEVAKVAEKVAEKVAKKLEEGKEGDEPKADDAKEGDQQAAPKAKPIVAYGQDGKPVELDADLEIEFKVDGKTEKLKLAEVRNQISGKVNWDRKNNEFFQTKKKFEEQVSFVNQQVDAILKLANEKPEAALFELARLAGKSPEEYAKMIAGTMEGANRWSEMTDLERKAAMVEAENVAYRNHAQRQKEEAERIKAEQQRAESINSLATELELTEDDISGLTEDIRTHAQIAQPTAEHLYTAWLFKNTSEAFQAVAPEALKVNPGLFNEAAQILLSNGIRNKADIVQIIQQAYGSEEDSARKVGRKVASQAPKTASAAAPSKGRELVSFDDV